MLPQIALKQPWTPIPNSSQEFALDTRAQQTLYHGGRGPGKTDTQLMRYYMRVGQGYGPFWKGIIFDREYKNLDDIIGKSKRWFYGRNDGAKFLEGTANLKWIWPTGEELLFRVIKIEADYWNYHGQEFPFIGWNELCKYPSPTMFDMMMSCNRSSWTVEKDGTQQYDHEGLPQDQPPIPLEVFATANPYGPGHGWVKRRFIDASRPGEIKRTPVDVFDPKTQTRKTVLRSQVHIFGSPRENIYLDSQYMASLESERDPNKRKAWLYGDWNIVAGGAFDDLWRQHIHVLPRFVVPENWKIDRAFDWGSTSPYSCVWFAEANGEEIRITRNGEWITWAPVKNSLIAISEIYGGTVGENKGNKYSATRVAQLIRDHEIMLMAQGWIKNQPMPGPADNQIRNVMESDQDTIETKMADVGIRWEPSDKSPGSRINGLQLCRDRLEAAVTKEGPALYFMDNCDGCITLLPQLPRDPDNLDDVDTMAEDHNYDATRYRVLKAANRIEMNIQAWYPT